MAFNDYYQQGQPSNQFLDQPLSLIQPSDRPPVQPFDPGFARPFGGGVGQGAGLPGGNSGKAKGQGLKGAGGRWLESKGLGQGSGKELVGKGLTKILGKGLMTKGGGIAGKLATKGGVLGSIGKASNPTPWGLGGLAASALGDVIAKKHAKTGGAISGAGKGAATGAMIGSVIPGLGTAVGGIAGGLIGGIKGLFGGKKKLKEKQKAEAAAKAGAPGLTNIGGNGNWKAGALGPVVQSDPYGQLRAETEARYRPTASPFVPMPQFGQTQPMNLSNPWANDQGIGGQGSWGG